MPHACWDVRRRDFDYEQLRRALAQFERAKASFLADYYPLTPYAAGDDAVVAWQLSRPEAEQGFIQAFRRAKGDAKATKLKLQGLEIGAKYEIENLDGGKQTRTDRGLLEQGLAVNFPAAPAALLYGPISVSEVPASSAGVADRSDTPIKGTMEAKAERTTLDNARACAMESTA